MDMLTRKCLKRPQDLPYQVRVCSLSLPLSPSLAFPVTLTEAPQGTFLAGACVCARAPLVEKGPLCLTLMCSEKHDP